MECSSAGFQTHYIDTQSMIQMLKLIILFFSSHFFCRLFLGTSQVQAQNCHLRELDLCAASLLVFTQGPSGKEHSHIPDIIIFHLTLFPLKHLMILLSQSLP
jgi:hypothetical protein